MPSIDFAALSFLPFGWRREIADALRAGAHPREVLAHLVDTQPQSPDLTVESLQRQAADAVERTRLAGLELIDWPDERYPPAVAAIADPPPVLWMRGQVAALEPPAVAIVGSRAGSAYALAVAERLAGDVASRGISIVSGLARGVDSAAHRVSLAAGGTTIAVLGTGADIVYPNEHKALAKEIAATGAVLSELPPGTSPLPMFFPMRNRIISGLSRAIVVVEASEKSGSLITARWALEQGRNVLAVPGNVLNGRNRGGPALLKDG